MRGASSNDRLEDNQENLPRAYSRAPGTDYLVSVAVDHTSFETFGTKALETSSELITVKLAFLCKGVGKSQKEGTTVNEGCEAAQQPVHERCLPYAESTTEIALTGQQSRIGRQIDPEAEERSPARDLHGETVVKLDLGTPGECPGVNAQNDSGDTAMMLALRDDQLEFAQWILDDPHTDVLLRNLAGEDAIDICESLGLQGMRMKLESKARHQAELQAEKEKSAAKMRDEVMGK
ncbi:osm1 [Symbiodinium sp. CCMP2592]|nr:osm1 [Symbiodinium sp. CCMP2592]